MCINASVPGGAGLTSPHFRLDGEKKKNATTLCHRDLQIIWEKGAGRGIIERVLELPDCIDVEGL